MQRWLVAAVIVAAVAVAAAVTLRWHATEPRAQVVARYCSGCHNEIDVAGGFAFDSVDTTDVARDPALWEAVVRKLRTGLMPPKGEPRPERSALDSIASQLELELDTAAARAPNPGAKPLARLNRTEYTN